MWQPVAQRLRRETPLLLDLPGFGMPRPPGFTATKDAYVDWLIDELEALDTPVDLVGHDWGGAFVVRVASLRPDLVRSWASDALAMFANDFTWHEYARVWQDLEAGAAFVAAALSTTDEQVADAYAAWGVPHEAGFAIRSAWTEELWASALDLYRSATDVNTEWGPALPFAGSRPGLALIPTAESFLKPEWATQAAEIAGARIVELKGLDHWWLVQDPALAADQIRRFWASLELGARPR